MASSNSQTPGRAKWGVGSFFQQAVTSVESRLDTILADEDGTPNKTVNPPGTQSEHLAQPSGMYMDGTLYKNTACRIKLTGTSRRPIAKLVPWSIERPSPGALSPCCCQAECGGEHRGLCVISRSPFPDSQPSHSYRQ